jgi:hypothetical protein
MQIKCPKDNRHNKFVGAAHVTQDWILDSDGNYYETIYDEPVVVLHSPDADDVITCYECGTEAKVV